MKLSTQAREDLVECVEAYRAGGHKLAELTFCNLVAERKLTMYEAFILADMLKESIDRDARIEKTNKA